MTLFDLFSLMRKHLKTMIALPILGLLISLGISMILQDKYTAYTTMYVLARSESADVSTLTYSDLSASQMLTSDVATLMQSERVENDVSEKLGLADLRNYDINVTSSTSTRVITLAVTNEDPQKAADVANEIVQDVSVVAGEVMQVESINVIDRAKAPEKPSGPRRALICAAGAAIGFFLGIAIIIVQDLLDKRMHTDEEVQELLGVAVISHFPIVEE